MVSACTLGFFVPHQAALLLVRLPATVIYKEDAHPEPNGPTFTLSQSKENVNSQGMAGSVAAVSAGELGGVWLLRGTFKAARR